MTAATTHPFALDARKAKLAEALSIGIVEAVVHGIDLTDAVGRAPIATPAGVDYTAWLLDELLARRTVAGRPADLASDGTIARPPQLDNPYARLESGAGTLSIGSHEIDLRKGRNA